MSAEANQVTILRRFDEKVRREGGYKCVVGIDEAGRGPLAGPVVAAACFAPPKHKLKGVNDSKQLSEKDRIHLYSCLTQDPDVIYGIGVASVNEIDEINIFHATKLAMNRAVNALSCVPDYLLVDGLALTDISIPCQKVIKGDALSYLIAAASILAKEYRDRLMREYHQQWPHYGFARHKGYHTEEHVNALYEHGPCPLHRRSFEPVKSLVTTYTLN